MLRRRSREGSMSRGRARLRTTASEWGLSPVASAVTCFQNTSSRSRRNNRRPHAASVHVRHSALCHGALKRSAWTGCQGGRDSTSRLGGHLASASTLTRTIRQRLPSAARAVAVAPFSQTSLASAVTSSMRVMRRSTRWKVSAEPSANRRDQLSCPWQATLSFKLRP